MKNRARKLRSDQTKTEALLWSKLRNRRLKGFKFRRQHPVGGYILDFYCSTANVAVELDGGGHARSEQQRYDMLREDRLNKAGIKILRFWDNEVWSNLEGVLKKIMRELENRTSDHSQEKTGKKAPSPYPLPGGERD